MAVCVSPPISQTSPTASSSSRPSRRREDQERHLRRARRGRDRPGCRSRLQHFLDPDHEARHLRPQPRASHRHALLQPGTGAAARRIRDHRSRPECRRLAPRRGFAGDILGKQVVRWPTAPASSSTRCSCRTCSRRSAWSSPASPPRKTSTRQRFWASRTRWVRWRSTDLVGLDTVKSIADSMYGIQGAAVLRAAAAAAYGRGRLAGKKSGAASTNTPRSSSHRTRAVSRPRRSQLLRRR